MRVSPAWQAAARAAVLATVVALLVGPATAAAAQPVTPEQALERLFRERPVAAEWFAPSFLAQVPAAQLEQIVAQIVAVLGPFERVVPEGVDFVVVLEQGEVPTKVALDEQGRFAGLLFQAPRARLSNLDAALAAFRELPGRASVVVVENGRVRAAIAPDEPLAVGSAFKLAVLAALEEQVVLGQRRWDEVVSLRPEWKSLPSGILQEWPAGSPVTLHTLAGLMVSLSDNTAADALLHLAGRDAVEVKAPRNRPFLTTREAFLLKALGNEALLERYRGSGETERRSMLSELARLPLPPADSSWVEPRALDVEWFLTGRELCALMDQVRDLPLMGINPGVVRRDDWAAVAFKGGSEPGVLNLTTGLLAKDGRRLCVAATWNDNQALDEARFVSLYSGLLGVLR